MRKRRSFSGARPKPRPRTRRDAAGFISASPSPREGIGHEGAALRRKEDEGAAGDPMRLNRWLAEQGVDSRRKCDQLVLEGAVSINGEIVGQPGARVKEGDEVRVNGVRIKPVRRLYYLFNKPRGVICTNDRREHRTRLCDLVDPLTPSRVYPIGRLDEDSEGLLILTNDGDFANLISHPRYGVGKTYYCIVSASLDADALARIKKGAFVEGGRIVPEAVRLVKRTPKMTTLEITLRESRNKEVRRLLSRHGFGVKTLKRIRIGELALRGLKRGHLRAITREERDAMVAALRPS